MISNATKIVIFSVVLGVIIPSVFIGFSLLQFSKPVTVNAVENKDLLIGFDTLVVFSSPSGRTQKVLDSGFGKVQMRSLTPYADTNVASHWKDVNWAIVYAYDGPSISGFVVYIW